MTTTTTTTTLARVASVRLALAGCVFASAAAPHLAGAQSLAQRIAQAPDGLVQFTYAARPGVCGNGRSFISTGDGNFIGSFNGYIGDVSRNGACEPGPVRVVLNRADRTVIDIDTYVGPPSMAPGAADLGKVSPSDAADYLLSIAARTEGKPSRDAIFPATLADGAAIAPALLAIARDRDRPRETRRSALSALARDDAGGGERMTSALVAIARDDTDNQDVRKQALSVLSRSERGDGVPALMELTRAGTDMWLVREATLSLARSGDPRSRQFLRSAAQREDLPEELRVAALKGIGGSYATSQDAEFLRGIYPRLTSDQAKEAVISSVTEMGGAESARWLLALARNADEPIKLRRRAVQSAAKAGAPAADIVRLYDSANDPQIKEVLIDAYASGGDRAGVDKLLSIAKTEGDRNLRRRAITRLSRSDDPRVKQVLQEIVER
ncbi:MAG: HEAT repeat domain-containing protein [Gemmatimonadaceae bacterium]